MHVIRTLRPTWRALAIHECSPTADRGPSVPLASQCTRYTPTHYWPDLQPGQIKNGVRCEDVERQTFEDQIFDLVVVQDVYEHIFNPEAATREIYRTLKPGGMAFITTGVWKDKLATEQWSRKRADGSIEFLVMPPEYHGNPISSEGSLVTYKFGYDFVDLLAAWAPFSVSLWRFNDRYRGIVGEFTDVVICERPER
jgi:SAM-dependent methyltransferase